jgi:hypothetical protein
MAKYILLGLFINIGSVLQAAMPTGCAFSHHHESSALENIRTVNIQEMRAIPLLTQEIKESLLETRLAILNNPQISKETAFLVLKDCSRYIGLCRALVDLEFSKIKHPLLKKQRGQNLLEKEREQKFNFIARYGMEVLWLIRNLALHAANIYYEGLIPEGILDVTPSGVEGMPKEYLCYLVHLKTELGSVFLNMPTLEREKIATSYMREYVVTGRRTLVPVDLLYNGRKVIHESGFYLDLDNHERYPFALGGYVGSKRYEMGDRHFTSNVMGRPDITSFTANPAVRTLLGFAIQELGNKIGGIEKLADYRTFGELLFLPFPILPKDQEEAAYSEDLFQAQQAIQFLKTVNFLLESIPENVDDIDMKARNEEKRNAILSRKKTCEERLVRLAQEYQTTSDALVATIEGKLLTLNEAEYQQKIQDEQEKIRAQLESRTKPGVMGGKKLSRKEKQEAKDAAVQKNKDYAEEMQQKLGDIIHNVRTTFLARIKGRYGDRQHVLRKFHDQLQENNIPFHVTQSGSHRVTHTEGAAPVTVVEEHKGTAEFSGATIRKMLQVFGSALAKQFGMNKSLAH